MKIDPNDPRITAFALGELQGQDATELARAVRMDTTISAAVDEARETAAFLGGTLGSGDQEWLTPDQRDVIRRAGSSTVITDIASAQVPFWKKPAVVGVGAAAVVALGLFVILDQPEPTSGTDDNGQMANWDWSQVPNEDLIAPIDGNLPEDSASADAQVVSSPVRDAIHDQPSAFVEAVESAVSDADISDDPSLDKHLNTTPESTIPWQYASRDSTDVPTATGAASWPWLVRHVTENNRLPAAGTIHIEELINYFSYSPPESNQVASLELSSAPWNDHTLLLAVKLSSQASSHKPQILFNTDLVKRFRILGYHSVANEKPQIHTAPIRMAAQARGNYVFYEFETKTPHVSIAPADVASLVTLSWKEGERTPVALQPDRLRTWSQASEDYRFATTLAALGLAIANDTDAPQLRPGKIKQMLDDLEKSSPKLGEKKSQAIELMRKTLPIIGSQSRPTR